MLRSNGGEGSRVKRSGNERFIHGTRKLERIKDLKKYKVELGTCIYFFHSFYLRHRIYIAYTHSYNLHVRNGNSISSETAA